MFKQHWCIKCFFHHQDVKNDQFVSLWHHCTLIPWVPIHTMDDQLHYSSRNMVGHVVIFFWKLLLPMFQPYAEKNNNKLYSTHFSTSIIVFTVGFSDAKPGGGLSKALGPSRLLLKKSPQRSRPTWNMSIMTSTLGYPDLNTGVSLSWTQHWGIMTSTLGFWCLDDLRRNFRNLHILFIIYPHTKKVKLFRKETLSKFQGWLSPQIIFFLAISIGIWVTPVTLVKINKEHLQSRALNNLPVNLWWSVRGFLAISPSEPRKKPGLTFHCILVV